MEPIFYCQTCTSDYRNTKSPCLVGLSPFQDLQFLIRFSVSSVNTLEDAKVAKGCLYIQMPIQEVSDELGVHVLY